LEKFQSLEHFSEKKITLIMTGKPYNYFPVQVDLAFEFSLQA